MNEHYVHNILLEIQNDIAYYLSYKNNLVQYVISRNTLLNKHSLSPEEITQIIEEISFISKKIYLLRRSIGEIESLI